MDGARFALQCTERQRHLPASRVWSEGCETHPFRGSLAAGCLPASLANYCACDGPNAEESAVRLGHTSQPTAYIFSTAACLAINFCAWRSLPRASRAVCSGVSDDSWAACAAGLKVTVVEGSGAAGAVTTSRSGVASGLEAPSLSEVTGGGAAEGGVLEIDVSTSWCPGFKA